MIRPKLDPVVSSAERTPWFLVTEHTPYGTVISQEQWAEGEAKLPGQCQLRPRTLPVGL